MKEKIKENPVCCEYCRKQSPKDIQLDCHNTRVIVIGESLVISDSSGDIEFSTINFCPMCGRKLR